MKTPGSVWRRVAKRSEMCGGRGGVSCLNYLASKSRMINHYKRAIISSNGPITPSEQSCQITACVTVFSLAYVPPSWIVRLLPPIAVVIPKVGSSRAITQTPSRQNTYTSTPTIKKLHISTAVSKQPPNTAFDTSDGVSVSSLPYFFPSQILLVLPRMFEVVSSQRPNHNTISKSQPKTGNAMPKQLNGLSAQSSLLAHHITL